VAVFLSSAEVWWRAASLPASVTVVLTGKAPASVPGAASSDVLMLDERARCGAKSAVSC